MGEKREEIIDKREERINKKEERKKGSVGLKDPII